MNWLQVEIVAALIWIGLFKILVGATFRRDGRVGWAMAIQTAVIGIAYLYAAAMNPPPQPAPHEWARQAVLFVVVATVTWAEWEVVHARWGWRTLPGRVARRVRAAICRLRSTG